MLCKVITSSRSASIGNGLTYDAGNDSPPVGSPVSVPLRNRIVEGIVIGLAERTESDTFKTRSIAARLGSDPLLTDEQIATALWMAEYYCCSVRQALGVWLPSPPWRLLLPKPVVGYRVAKAAIDPRGKRQRELLDVLNRGEWTAIDTICDEIGNVASSLKALGKRGAIIRETRLPHSSPVGVLRTEQLTPPTLTQSQSVVCDEISRASKPTLLFGVTGSGKTEVYARLIVETLQSGKHALLLVPEILLTEQTITRFQKLIPRQHIAVLHSKLTPVLRREEWKRIHSGAVSLVIGSRSALFAPLKRLGIIVIDEEHEWTYKNEQSPRYHVRDTAEALANRTGAKLVLGSATPSLESWTRAKEGRYELSRLPERYGNQPLPRVTIVDLTTVTFGRSYPFSPTLLQAIDVRLRRNEQCVLFLNRRGVASAMLCRSCRRRIVCPESQLPYSVHSDGSGTAYLLDHTTGQTAPIPARCPSCGSPEVFNIGAGTQKLEHTLRTHFPHVGIVRADSDTLTGPEQMQAVLAEMRDRKASILLGTQSVVKGLDLPHVTLAGVLLADIGLSLPHFRAGERVFQLLTQLVGRSGRSAPGEVIIQTFRPSAPEVLAAASHGTEKYLDDELRLRAFGGYPPATRMIRFLARGQGAQARATKLLKDLRTIIAARGDDHRVTASKTFFGAGSVWQVLLRGPDPRSCLPSIDLSDLSVDVDPLDTV